MGYQYPPCPPLETLAVIRRFSGVDIAGSNCFFNINIDNNVSSMILGPSDRCQVESTMYYMPKVGHYQQSSSRD